MASGFGSRACVSRVRIGNLIVVAAIDPNDVIRAPRIEILAYVTSHRLFRYLIAGLQSSSHRVAK